MQVIIIREAFCDTPEAALGMESHDDRMVRARIVDYFWGTTVKFDNQGGLDTGDGRSFVFDTLTVVG